MFNFILLYLYAYTRLLLPRSMVMFASSVKSILSFTTPTLTKLKLLFSAAEV